MAGRSIYSECKYINTVEIIEHTSIDMAKQLALQAVEADRTSKTKEE
jgi:hypothetical protein